MEVKHRIISRLNEIGLPGEKWCQKMKEYGLVMAGSFPLQCLLDEMYKDSNINIYYQFPKDYQLFLMWLQSEIRDYQLQLFPKQNPISSDVINILELRILDKSIVLSDSDIESDVDSDSDEVTEKAPLASASQRREVPFGMNDLNKAKNDEGEEIIRVEFIQVNFKLTYGEFICTNFPLSFTRVLFDGNNLNIYDEENTLSKVGNLDSKYVGSKCTPKIRSLVKKYKKRDFLIYSLLSPHAEVEINHEKFVNTIFKKGDLLVKLLNDEVLCLQKSNLTAKSLVFKGMFLHNEMVERVINEVNLIDYNAISYIKFFIFIYTNKIYINHLDEALHLLFISDKYQINKLKEIVSVYIQQNISNNNLKKIITYLQPFKHIFLDLYETVIQKILFYYHSARRNHNRVMLNSIRKLPDDIRLDIFDRTLSFNS